MSMHFLYTVWEQHNSLNYDRDEQNLIQRVVDGGEFADLGCATIFIIKTRDRFIQSTPKIQSSCN
jgi:hypothetical protein